MKTLKKIAKPKLSFGRAIELWEKIADTYTLFHILIQVEITDLREIKKAASVTDLEGKDLVWLLQATTLDFASSVDKGWMTGVNALAYLELQNILEGIKTPQDALRAFKALEQSSHSTFHVNKMSKFYVQLALDEIVQKSVPLLQEVIRQSMQDAVSSKDVRAAIREEYQVLISRIPNPVEEELENSVMWYLIEKSS